MPSSNLISDILPRRGSDIIIKGEVYHNLLSIENLQTYFLLYRMTRGRGRKMGIMCEEKFTLISRGFS